MEQNSVLNVGTNFNLTLTETIDRITPTSKIIETKVLSRFHQLAIPIDSLGKLQSNIVDVCMASNTTTPDITKRAVVVFCSDNGVVEEGISQVGCEVTTAVAKCLCNHSTVMCRMAEFSKVDVIPVDIGMKDTFDNSSEFSSPLLKKAISRGTNNIKMTHAMSIEQAIESIEVGINLAIELSQKGYKLLATGEMGIGNTTTSTAMASVLLDLDVDSITGAGAGLSPEGIARKKAVISRSIEVNSPDKHDIIDVLHKLGGYDIGGMIGLMLGCAYLKIPCVVDGFISNVAALCATRLCEQVDGYLIFSHTTQEKGGQAIIEALGKSPMLDANMRLGEGSGAVALIPLLDMGMKVYYDMVTFDDMHIDPYVVF